MYDIDILIGLLVSDFRLTLSRWKIVLKTYTNLNAAIDDKFSKIEGESDWCTTLQKVVSWDVLYLDFKIKLELHNVKIISILSRHYPSSLAELSDKPVVLFYQGNITLIHERNLLTVVGSRNHTRYTEKVIESVLAPAVCSGVIVVSGLAAGIDALAHRVAVDNRRKTIGVIGSGLDDNSFYPTTNLPLKNQILESGGLILSEYPIGFAATKFSFPRRNRILAALSSVTWIVEAGKKSGSLITAQEAQKLGRKVVTTLVPLFEEQFAGNIDLFRSGSRAITQPEDLLEEVGVLFSTLRVATPSSLPTDKVQLLIYNTLDIAGKQVEQLAEELGILPQKLMSILSIMELEGYAENIGQNVWIKK